MGTDVAGTAANTPGRVVLFDLDGCILDSTEPVLQCLNAALVEFELGSLTRYDLNRFIGPPLQLTLRALLDEKGASPDLVGPLMETYRSYYRTASLELALTYRGIPEAIADLATTNRLGVCTSKPTHWAAPILDHLGLSAHFEIIAGPDLTETEGKVETMTRALAELEDVDPSTSVMIGDRRHDVEAALHHGLRPIGVTWGFGSRDELEEAGAAHIVDHPSELVALIAGF